MQAIASAETVRDHVDTFFEKAALVLFDGVPYRSNEWNQGESPDAAAANADGSPWTALPNDVVPKLLDALPQ